jgi:uncharacterized protein with HEPN domain
MKNKDNLAYLKLILGAMNKIGLYIDGLDYDSFSIDSKTQSAVLMQLQIIGELAKRIPENVLSEIEIPWKKIMGLRDIVSHDYFSLDIKMVWQTINGSIYDAQNKIGLYLQALR